MWFVYVLKSERLKKFYTGKTNDLKRRLNEHNAGKSMYAKKYTPWRIIYHESLNTEAEAVKREKYLKSAAGRRWLRKNIKL